MSCRASRPSKCRIRRTPATTAVAVAFLILGIFGDASACSIPVFRFALDHWHADPYRLELPVTAPAISELLPAPAENVPVNLDVIRDSAPASPQSPPGSVATPQDPSPGNARLFFPGYDEQPAWTGPVDSSMAQKLVDSPARREIAKRIKSGDSAVWLLVQSGDSVADSAAENLLSSTLRAATQSIKLPKIDPRDEDARLRSGPEIRVKFSILKLRRDDPAEALFIPQLIGPGKNSPGLAEPLFVPVFGQGRALARWPASKANEETLVEACKFLCGSCSCEVKALNPGWDLLMQCAWNASPEQPGDFGSTHTQESALGPSAPIPIADGMVDPVSVAPTTAHTGHWLEITMILTGIIAVASGILMRRRARS